MVNKTIKSVLYLTIFLINFSTLAHDYSKVWEKGHKSTVVVLPTWPGYNKHGFGAPHGTAPAGTGFYLSLDKKEKMTKSKTEQRERLLSTMRSHLRGIHVWDV